VPGAVATSGAGVVGAAGATRFASSDGAKAITSERGAGGGDVSAGGSARNGDSAAATLGAASVLRWLAALGWASGAIAAVRLGVGVAGADGVSAGPSEPRRPTDACSKGSATGATADSASASCAGTSTRCSSGTVIRRSCQGKRKPRRLVPSPSKTTFNSSAWMSSESSSARDSRLRSALMRRFSGGPQPAACGEPAGFGSAGLVGRSRESVGFRMRGDARDYHAMRRLTACGRCDGNCQSGITANGLRADLVILEVFRDRRAVGLPEHRHHLLVAESTLAPRLLAVEGAIFPGTNGPKNQLRSQHPRCPRRDTSVLCVTASPPRSRHSPIPTSMCCASSPTSHTAAPPGS